MKQTHKRLSWSPEIVKHFDLKIQKNDSSTEMKQHFILSSLLLSDLPCVRDPVPVVSSKALLLLAVLGLSLKHHPESKKSKIVNHQNAHLNKKNENAFIPQRGSLPQRFFLNKSTPLRLPSPPSSFDTSLPPFTTPRGCRVFEVKLVIFTVNSLLRWRSWPRIR